MSEKYASCQHLLDRLTHVFKKMKLFEKFMQLETIEKKVTFCWTSNSIKYDDSITISIRKELSDFIDWLYLKAEKHGKSFEIADQFKIKGSKAFMKKKDNDAFKFYTEGLRYAPNNSPIVAVLYANRSATHIQRKRFEECLMDIERAEKAGYPSNSKFKLYKRKIEALFKLGRTKEAHITFQNIKDNLSPTDIDTISKSIVELEEKMSSLSTETTVQESKNAINIELYQQDGNNEMSGVLKMRMNNSDGRFITVTQDVPKGSALFKEKPFASILLPEYFLTNCQNCFQPLENPVPCNNCSDIFWCGENCRSEGNRFHQYECCNLHILTSVGIAHLSVRIVLLAGWEICQQVRNENIDITSEEQLCTLFQAKDKSSRYKSVYSLVTHLDKAASDDQFQYCLAGIILGKVITEKSEFLSPLKGTRVNSPFEGTDSEVTLASVLAHHIAQLVSNAHAITQIEGNALEGCPSLFQTSQRRIATAIYPLASLMNHSCRPSIINSFHGDVLIIHSIEDIRRGDQIFNCYGPHASRQIREERQTALNRQYYFDCRCQACIDDQLLIKEASWSGLRCPKCRGVAELIEEEDLTLEKKLFKCHSCETNGALPHEIVEKCSHANNFYEDGEDLFKLERHEEAEECFTKAFNIGKDVYCENNEFFNTIRDDLAKCYASQGKFKNALELLRLCIKTVETRYGEESIEVSHELLKYLDVLRMNQLCKNRFIEIEETKQRIEAIVKMNYGISCQLE